MAADCPVSAAGKQTVSVANGHYWRWTSCFGQLIAREEWLAIANYVQYGSPKMERVELHGQRIPWRMRIDVCSCSRVFSLCEPPY
jgi:hypothetical protein